MCILYLYIYIGSILNFLFFPLKTPLLPGTRRRATRLRLWCLTACRRGDDWGTHGCANGRSGRTLEVPQMKFPDTQVLRSTPFFAQTKKMEIHIHTRTRMDVLRKNLGGFSSGKSVISHIRSGALILGFQMFHHFDPLELQLHQRRSRVRWLLVRWSHQSQGFQANPTEHYVRLISWSLGGSLGWKNLRVVGSRKYIHVNFIYLVLKDFFRWFNFFKEDICLEGPHQL